MTCGDAARRSDPYAGTNPPGGFRRHTRWAPCVFCGEDFRPYGSRGAGACGDVFDELGFIPFDRAGGELLFNLLTERYERRSVIVTTNLAFGEWVKVFGGGEKLTTALLNRLAHHATVICHQGKSYRMRKRAPNEPKNDPSPSPGLPNPAPKK